MVYVEVYTNYEFFSSDDPKQKKPIYGFKLDDGLKANIDGYLIPAVAKKWDGIMLVTGIEGSGKSTIAQSLAFYVDPTFNINQLVFSPEQLMEAIDDSRPGQAIIFDEAVMGMLAQDAATAVQSVLIKKFVTIRKKRLFIFIVIPSIFLLRKYFAIFRTRGLIHTFTPDGLSRGFFKFYGYNTKRELYIRGLKEFNQGAVEPDFSGRFEDTEGYFINVDDYDRKKDEAIISLTPKDGEGKKITATQMKQLEERHLFLMLAYNLFRYHVNWKLRFKKKSALKPNAAGFSKFVKEKLGYSIGSAGILAGVRDGINILDKAEDMKEKLGKIEKIIEIKD